LATRPVSPAAAPLTGLVAKDRAIDFESIPMVLNAAVTDPAAPHRMALGRNGLYVTQGQPDKIGNVVRTILAPARNGAVIEDIAYGGFQPDPANPAGPKQAVPNAMYVARGGELLVNEPSNPNNLVVDPARPADAFKFVARTPLDKEKPKNPSLIEKDVLGIAVDPANWRHAFIIDGSRAYETPDAGLHWTRLTRIPGVRLHSIALVPNQNGSLTVVIGTSRGVYAANANPAATANANNSKNVTTDVDWHELGVGVPSVMTTPPRPRPRTSSGRSPSSS
jgi:hypothetical protein